jgi:hypothetical protein
MLIFEVAISALFWVFRQRDEDWKSRVNPEEIKLFGAIASLI